MYKSGVKSSDQLANMTSKYSELSQPCTTSSTSIMNNHISNKNSSYQMQLPVNMMVDSRSLANHTNTNTNSLANAFHSTSSNYLANFGNPSNTTSSINSINKDLINSAFSHMYPVVSPNSVSSTSNQNTSSFNHVNSVKYYHPTPVTSHRHDPATGSFLMATHSLSNPISPLTTSINDLQKIVGQSSKSSTCEPSINFVANRIENSSAKATHMSSKSSQSSTFDNVSSSTGYSQSKLDKSELTGEACLSVGSSVNSCRSNGSDNEHFSNGDDIVIGGEEGEDCLSIGDGKSFENSSKIRKFLIRQKRKRANKDENNNENGSKCSSSDDHAQEEENESVNTPVNSNETNMMANKETENNASR
jgi:hypothetical protein